MYLENSLFNCEDLVSSGTQTLEIFPPLDTPLDSPLDTPLEDGVSKDNQAKTYSVFTQTSGQEYELQISNLTQVNMSILFRLFSYLLLEGIFHFL